MAGRIEPKRVAALMGWLVVAWLVMTLTHEAGHVLVGWLGGATLVEVRWWGLPYSVHEPDPHRAWTLWGGPMVGVLGPVLLAGGLSFLVRRRHAPAWRKAHFRGWFVADFCVLANGVYLALAWASGDPTLDTARLLEAEVPPVFIAMFCAATIGLGYVRFRRDVQRVLKPA